MWRFYRIRRAIDGEPLIVDGKLELETTVRLDVGGSRVFACRFIVKPQSTWHA
jgi:hypothetical protein